MTIFDRLNRTPDDDFEKNTRRFRVAISDEIVTVVDAFYKDGKAFVLCETENGQQTIPRSMLTELIETP